MDLPELWQTEWCPASHRVRQRLTELGIDCLLRQVEPARELRSRLRAQTGVDTVPVLRWLDGTVIVGEGEILAYLDRAYPENANTKQHRERAHQAFPRLVQQERDQGVFDE